jgi:hypothetical protein
MSEFLSSVKDDLLDVRLRLAVLLLAAGLIGAVAYAALGGGGSSPTAAATTGPVSTADVGIAISQAPTNTVEPVTETTNGTVHQRGGPLRDPFALLPAATAASATSKAAATPASPSASSGSSTSTSPSPSATTTPPATPKPTTPAKPKVTTRYVATAQFGVLPAPSIEGAPAAPAQLKTYSDMKLDEPLPDKSKAQLVFAGAVKHTRLEAVFTLTGESILHGNATCLPSATQCQAIRLQVGQSETLESIEPDGSPVTYELRMVSIERITKTVTAASAARAGAALLANRSQAGREVLQNRSVPALPGLAYSPQQGLLVDVPQPAPAARAHVATQLWRHER